MYIYRQTFSFIFGERSGIAGSYVKCMFKSVTKCQTIFHSAYSILLSQSHCVRASVAPKPCQHLIWSGFVVVVIVVSKFDSRAVV